MAIELITPRGGRVTVESAERAEVLKARGYKPADEPKKASPKKASKKKVD